MIEYLEFRGSHERVIENLIIEKLNRLTYLNIPLDKQYHYK